MALWRRGTVEAVETESNDLIVASVTLDDGRVVSVSAFPGMTGTLHAGDEVIVNTSGLDLGLGTGGSGFVLWNASTVASLAPRPGHIMKLRYTPWQMNVLAAEEQDAPSHAALADAVSIDGMPVVACGLHSQLAAVAAGIKAVDPALRVGYLMTDGGALPLAWSRLVPELRNAGLLDGTATCGHAFGGDLETVNVFSGLAALRHALAADVAVVALGPGVVGTGTRLGYSAVEQGQVLDAATALGGRAVACLRISWADSRPRHRGVSHHSLTALQIAARERCTVVVPALEPEQREEVTSQLVRAGIHERHDVIQGDGAAALELLASKAIVPTSMGRTVHQVPELFLAAGAAGRVAADMAVRAAG